MNKEINYNYKLPPFKWFCLTNFPFIEADFDALTYYELLCKVVQYLNEVIVKTNVIGEQTEELTNAFNTLKEYVDTYFDNLDVQEEINNKLDDMAESGQLADIIAQYLSLAGCLAFKTLNDMKNATNLVENSICMTFGKNTYNDGKGEHYLIRTMTSSDVVDNDNIVAVNFSNTLIAEKQQHNDINTLKSQMSTISPIVTDLNNEIFNEKWIILGDSYLEGAGLTNPTTENFGYLLREKLGMNSTNCKIIAEGGSGFTQKGNDNHTFLELLQSQIENIDTENTRRIIVAGGYNDITKTQVEIETAISSFITYCKTTFEKIDVYLANICGNSKISNASGTYRQWIRERSIPAYKNASKYGGIYINGCDKVLHNYNYITTGENLVHPNANGHEAIASYLYNAIKNGSYDYYQNQSTTNGTAPSGTSGSITFKTGIENDKSFLLLYANLTYTTPIPAAYINALDIGEQSLQYLRYVSTSTTNESETELVNVLYNDNTHGTVPCKVKINDANHIILKLGYVEKDIKTLEISYTKFYWDYLQV